MFAAKNELLTTPSGGYRISRSLRFRSSASAYLSRTFGTATSTKKYTFSFWTKRGALGGAGGNILVGGTGTAYGFGFNGTGTFGGTADYIYFTSSDSGATVKVGSNNLYRDASAFYHIVLSVDTTQSTASNRVKIYVNGAEVSYQFTTYPALNADTGVNTATSHVCGAWSAGTSVNYDGYLAEVNFIDGQALTPSSFGQSNALTGVWEPKQYTGTYGTNGFYLPFNPSAQSNGNDSYTTALLHFDSTLTLNSAVGGSTTWSSSGSTVATNSTNSITNFNNSATFTAANTDYITSTASSDYNFTGDFTIDFWYRPTSTSNQTIFRDVSTTDWNTCSTGDYACFIDGVRYLAFQIKGVGGPYDTAALTANTWYHVAIVRSGSTITLYKDGTSVSTFSYSGTIGNTKALEIGRAITNYTASGIDGRVDEFRVSKGIARWTANFTRPSLPYGQSIGADASGAGNYWEAYNVNAVSSGTTYDSMIDSPTNYADGGNGRGNYAVGNPLSVNSATLTDGNLGVSTSGVAGAVATAAGTIGVSSGKWYWETTVISNTTSDLMIGVVNITRAATARSYSNADTWYYYGANGNKYISGTGSAYGASYTNNNVIGIALDMDNGTIVFYKDGASQGTAASTGISGLTIVPVWGNATSGGAQVYAANFGQRPFTYTPPSGFSALNTQNLP